jgi:hypothetical protein
MAVGFIALHTPIALGAYMRSMRNTGSASSGSKTRGGPSAWSACVRMLHGHTWVSVLTMACGEGTTPRCRGRGGNLPVISHMAGREFGGDDALARLQVPQINSPDVLPARTVHRGEADPRAL